jgi:hypothetical protein
VDRLTESILGLTGTAHRLGILEREIPHTLSPIESAHPLHPSATETAGTIVDERRWKAGRDASHPTRG